MIAKIFIPVIEMIIVINKQTSGFSATIMMATVDEWNTQDNNHHYPSYSSLQSHNCSISHNCRKFQLHNGDVKLNQGYFLRHQEKYKWNHRDFQSDKQEDPQNEDNCPKAPFAQSTHFTAKSSTKINPLLPLPARRESIQCLGRLVASKGKQPTINFIGILMPLADVLQKPSSTTFELSALRL